MHLMRKLTFKGFLAQYIKRLSYAGTVDLELLADELNSGNSRLTAPLLLYAVTHNKTSRLRSALTAKGCPEGTINMLSFLEESNVEELLENGSLPEEYLKVWNSFLVRQAQPDNDRDLKAAMREKTLQLLKEKNCSNYRVYKDLNLNPGNVNCWLKNGDDSKVSYQTAEKIISYVMQY